MKLAYVELCGFRGYRKPIRIDFAECFTIIDGRNGVGKSTLMDLLCRFIEPDQGQIMINNVDIMKMELPVLRRQIGLVHQESQLLNRSIRENINYGRVDGQGSFVEREIFKAKPPVMLEFIEELKAGYDTEIIETGSNLSGGQRQRISLARILRNQQPIVILDEAMSMQDPNGETQFMAEAKALLEQQTVLIVSHNQSLTRYADRLITMELGVVSDDQVIGRA